MNKEEYLPTAVFLGWPQSYGKTAKRLADSERPTLEEYLTSLLHPAHMVIRPIFDGRKCFREGARTGLIAAGRR